MYESPNLPVFRQDWVVYAKRSFGGPEHNASLPGPLHVADRKVTFQ